jgi:A/G-specific adenine glycosylase
MEWYDRARRTLPWRATDDPYAIWVSEVMLQQTQTTAVRPYFERWMRAFPNVRDLAAASQERVFALWQGLGYYRRCENLMRGAKLVRERGWPRSVEEWRRLPGVGPYTAGAIASRVLNACTPAIDGNAARVYARVCLDPATGSKLASAAAEWSSRCMNEARPGDWNQALMELGARMCRPRAPLCGECPLKAYCGAFAQDRVEEFPMKRSRPKTVRIELRYDVPIFHQMVGVTTDDSHRWWRNLWVFPPHRSVRGDRRPLPRLNSVVTHHRVEFFSDLVLADRMEPNLSWRRFDEVGALALPSPHRRLLDVALREVSRLAY